MNQTGSDWISVVAACKILGVSRNTLKKLIREGTLPAYTIQGIAGYKIKRHDVEALLQPVAVETSKKQKRSERITRSKSRAR